MEVALTHDMGNHPMALLEFEVSQCLFLHHPFGDIGVILKHRFVVA
jgi:hypothetical protein